jgi:hypothetical protein
MLGPAHPLRVIRAVLPLALCWPLLSFAEEDWQEITTTRLPPVVTPVEPTPAATEPTGLPLVDAGAKTDAAQAPLDPDATTAPDLLDDTTLPGNAQITGAFGIAFDLPLDRQLIKGPPEWLAPPPLPAGQIYKPSIATKPLLISAVQVQPAVLPTLLAEAKHEYRCYVDFDDKPLWIVAQISRDMTEIVAILTRRYGEPTPLDNGQQQFGESEKIIRVSQVDEAGTLEYIHVSGLAAYLEQRNMTLREKFTAVPRLGLNPEEAKILALADQIDVISRKEDPAFGLPFGRRVNFRATPGEAVPFVPPRPLLGLGDGDYSIVVSPRLMPMVASLKIKGSKAVLMNQKQLLDEALLVVFGRFLKHSSRHSVISVQGLSMSVLQRGDLLTLSVHDATESRRVRNAERVQQHLVAEQAAADRKLQAALDAEAKALVDAENARLAILQAQRLEREARRAEEGF